MQVGLLNDLIHHHQNLEQSFLSVAHYGLKRLDIPVDHPLLRRVRRVLLRLHERGVYLRQRPGEVAVLHGDFCGCAVYGRVVRGAGEVGFGGGDEEDELGGGDFADAVGRLAQ